MCGTKSSVAQDKFIFASLCVSLRANTHSLSLVSRLSVVYVSAFLLEYSDCITHSLFSPPPRIPPYPPYPISPCE